MWLGSLTSLFESLRLDVTKSLERLRHLGILAFNEFDELYFRFHLVAAERMLLELPNQNG